MSTKVETGHLDSRIRGAESHTNGARETARKAIREADLAKAKAWSIRMEGYGGPAVVANHPAVSQRWIRVLV